MKTVAQIAKQIGVSKQAIYQFMDSDFKQKFSTIDGSLKINLKGEKLILEHFKADNLKTGNQKDGGNSLVASFLHLFDLKIQFKTNLNVIQYPLNR